jgi:hypothetical protein
VAAGREHWKAWIGCGIRVTARRSWLPGGWLLQGAGTGLAPCAPPFGQGRLGCAAAGPRARTQSGQARTQSIKSHTQASLRASEFRQLLLGAQRARAGSSVTFVFAQLRGA